VIRMDLVTAEITRVADRFEGVRRTGADGPEQRAQR